MKLANELKKIRLAYKNMLDRCENPKSRAFMNYGARGIAVCDRWKQSRDVFVEWALSCGHQMDLSLDRIDNSLGYSPENCRWATVTEQLRNQRRNFFISYSGITLTLAGWAERIGVRPDTLRRRLLDIGMPLDKALVTGRANAWRHGTRAGYELHSCRCEQCRESNAARHRIRRRARLRDASAGDGDVA